MQISTENIIHINRIKKTLEGICMRGRIYSDQRCAVCGGKFMADEYRGGLFCKKHPEQVATGAFRVQFGRQTRRRFTVYEEAQRFLDGLRWEVDQGTYDPRDYRADYPLGFRKLSEKWLSIKINQVKPKSFDNLRNYMSKASSEWGNRNIKSIRYGEIEDFLNKQKVSDKTKSNMKSCLHSFFRWLNRREKIAMPDFPEIGFELGFRKIIDKETQQKIIEELYRQTSKINIKIWLGIKWLSTYISIRPGEMLNLKEGDIDIKIGYFIIPHPKEKRPKIIPLIDEDIKILKAASRGSSELYFFRHVKGVSGVKAGQRFGDRYFYKWWKKACDSLGITGVDLYGGTRHSSVTYLRKYFTPEQIKTTTLHSTNKAFERYLQCKPDDAKEVYLKASERL